ncbi:MAG: aldo/keto reductase [Candidatus Kryptonium sp.]|nr:aldo/keto reductase [Candidatus Kryptonium sp.]MDW8108553.1 aldo/keto reductase [Candidatus Kryptonium sp.]
MEYRQFGQTEIKIPVITFGGWAIGGWYWGGTDEELSVKAIQKAIEVGMNCIDTAPVYGFGLGEEIVGKAIKGKRNEVIIATKCGLRWDTDEGEFFFDTYFNGKRYYVYKNARKNSIIEECERSLRRLNTDFIDIYQIHWPDKTTPIDESLEALTRLQEQGKIRAFGVSNFDANLMKETLKYMRVESNQVKYSLLDRSIEKELVPLCVENKISILAYSPLEQGLLTGKITMETEFKSGDLRKRQFWFLPENRKKVLDALEKIKPIAKERNVTVAQLVINWTFSQTGITTAIVGARNPEQVEENAKAATFKLTDEEIQKIREAFTWE